VARIEISRDAERDLIDIYLYGIEEFGLHQAEQYNEVLHGRIETVAENPSFGSDYGYVSEGVRRYESVSHAVYYRQIAGGIRVLRVLHGHMDPGRHLG
jgi:toxin ParE1/3/4